MIFASEDQKMMYTRIWKEIKKAINEVADYSKDYCVIRFDSDDVLHLSFMINFRSLTIIIRSVLKKDNKFYLQIYLDYCLYEI